MTFIRRKAAEQYFTVVLHLFFNIPQFVIILDGGLSGVKRRNLCTKCNNANAPLSVNMFLPCLYEDSDVTLLGNF